MIELRNEEQRKKYIQRLWAELFGEEPKKLADEFIDAGMMNYVYRVESGSRIIYLKQALERAKKAEKIGADLAGIPKERIQYEGKYIEVVSRGLPSGIELPRILRYDGENNILALSDVRGDGVLLEKSLLDGNFGERAAYNLGRFLGHSHNETLGKNVVIRGTEEEDLQNWHVFLNMRTKGILQKGMFPDDVRRAIEGIYDAARRSHTLYVVINMDCCPKNIYERPDGSIGLVDFELASGVGDPAYDLGFLVGHYFLMGVIKKDRTEDAIKAIKQVLRGYNEEMARLKDDNFDTRLIKYAGATMIYRITGSSPAPYIKPEAMPLIKEAGFHLITNRFERSTDGALEFLSKYATKR